MGKSTRRYKPAQLYDAGGDITKHWYIYYYFLNPDTGKFERFKEKLAINRQKTLVDRQLWGERAVVFMNRQLENGYDPFEEAKLENMLQSPVVVTTQQSHVQTYFPSSAEGNLVTLQKVVDKLSKGATKDAKNTYSLMMKRWSIYSTEKGIDKLAVNGITTDYVKGFMDHLQHEKRNAPKTINSTKAHLGQFWEELKEMKLVTSNPFREVKTISKRAARRFANKPKDPFMPPTTEELERIVKHLNDTGKRCFLRFVAMIYYEWVRPREITQLRLSNVDLKSATITFSTDITKNGKTATIQIVPPMLSLLKEMNIDKYPSHYYLFSKGYLPGDVLLDAKVACYNTWQRDVKDKLGVETNPYSLKHKGNIDYVRNNQGDKYDAKWHQRQNRHASLTQTEQYMRDLGVYFVDTEQLNFNGFM